jgi:hypothetical protein
MIVTVMTRVATRANLLIPIIKGWMTERALDVTSQAVQVHGGMGFIEETGAAQHFRDARILPIYEGTTAIQANDLVFRKTLRDNGAAVTTLFDEIEAEMQILAEHADDNAAANARTDDQRRWHRSRGHRAYSRRCQ